MVSTHSFADKLSSSELIFERMINQNMPLVIINAKDVKTDIGVINAKITRTGKISLSDTAKPASFSFPMAVTLNANIKQNLGAMVIDLQCASQFNTKGLIKITPAVNGQEFVTTTVVDIPVPEGVEADCKGIRLPVTAPLRNLIAQQKIQLEQAIDARLKEELNRVSNPL